MTSIRNFDNAKHNVQQERPANLFTDALACEIYDRKPAFSVTPGVKEL